MGIKWKCIEPLTAIGCGIGAFALGSIDGGLTAGAIVAGSSLVRHWNEAKQNPDFDCPRLLEEHSQRIMSAWQPVADESWIVAADLEAADERLAEHLAEAIPSAKVIGSLLGEGKTSKFVALGIVDKLSERDDCRIFGEEGKEGASKTARTFALTVVEATFDQALDSSEYAENLHIWISLTLSREVAKISDKIDSVLARTNSAQLNNPNAFLRDVLMKELEARPGATEEELAQAVMDMKQQHDMLKHQISQIEAKNGQVESLKAEAEQAMAAYDHIEVARLFGELRAIQDERVMEEVKQSAQFASGQAAALLLAGDWRAAASVWTDASGKIEPLDNSIADELRYEAGRKLVEFGQRYGGGSLAKGVEIFRSMLKSAEASNDSARIARAANGLGNALANYGGYLGGKDGRSSLEEALSVRELAANHVSKENEPAFWVLSQMNLAISFAKLGTLFGQAPVEGLLRKSASILNAALSVCKGSKSVEIPIEVVSQIRFNLVGAETNLARCVGREESLKLCASAAANLTDLMNSKFIDSGSGEHAKALNNLGSIHQIWSKGLGGEQKVIKLGHAIDCYNQSREIHVVAGHGLQIAKSHENVASCFFKQAECDPQAEVSYLKSAEQNLVKAVEIFEKFPESQLVKNAQVSLNFARLRLAGRG
jgi:hypothetical protein